MNKRDFLKKTALATTGLATVPAVLVSACKDEPRKEGAKNNENGVVETAVFTLPELQYSYDAFTDTIDAMTMEIHYSKHHQGYVNKLNAALKENNIAKTTLETLLKSDDLPEAIRNNGGGHFNHSLYWDILTPGGTMSEGLKAKIVRDFGSEEAFINELTTAGKKRFGSGWAWVCQDNDKKLFITSTPNQDNPLMKSAEDQGHPILGVDVWEHAYYLKYQNKRGDYLNKITAIINWSKVEERML